MTTVLLAPPEPDHPTGGFIYNRRVADILADDGSFIYLCRSPGEIGTAAKITREYGASIVILDSLYFGFDGAALVKELRAAGHVVGWMVHALGSQISGGPGSAGSAAAETADAEAEALLLSSFAVVPSLYMKRHLEPFFDISDVGIARPGSDGVAGALRRYHDLDRKSALSRLAERHGVSVDPTMRILVTAGSVSPVKNQAWFARVISEVPDVAWLVVGSSEADAEYSGKLDRTCRTLGVSERVHRIPPVSQDDLAVVFSAADGYVQPSTFESYGIAAAEARAVSLPVIASDVGGLPEAVEGVLCSVGNIDGWRTAVESLRRREPEATLSYRAGAHTWAETAASFNSFLEERCQPAL